MATITKRELAEAISQKLGSPQIVTKQTIQLFLELCTEELVNGNRLEFRDFGILTTVERGSQNWEKSQDRHNCKCTPKKNCSVQVRKTSKRKGSKYTLIRRSRRDD